MEGISSYPVEFSQAEEDFLKSNVLMFVSSVSSAGYPRVIPMRLVNSPTALYFVITDTKKNPHKVANLSNSNKVAAIVHEMGRTPRGIHVQGIAVILDPDVAGDEYAIIKALFEGRHDYYKANNISSNDSLVKLEVKYKKSWGV